MNSQLTPSLTYYVAYKVSGYKTDYNYSCTVSYLTCIPSESGRSCTEQWRDGSDCCFMFFSCLFVFINTVADWNIWWVEEKLEVAMLTRLLWPLITSSITIGCIVFSILSFKEYSDRTISRREHVSGAVQIDAAITGLHDGVQCIISFIILASYTYYYYYSCTDQSKPIPVADESGLDGLETVRAILGSSFASFIISVCRFIRKWFQSDNTQKSFNILYVLIIIVNIIIMVFALWLRHVGVC